MNNRRTETIALAALIFAVMAFLLQLQPRMQAFANPTAIESASFARSADPLAADSAFPVTFAYQGVLRDSSGSLLADNTYQLTFTLYDAATLGNIKYQEVQQATVRNGFFSVILGNQNPPIDRTIFTSSSNTYIGVTFGADIANELKPRQMIRPVPLAVNADLLDGQDASQLVPPGTVVAFAGPTAPAGWLLCNGAAVSRSTYSALFAVIGTAHGKGDGSTTFTLPDYRGRFLRGVDAGAGRDPNASTRTAANPGGNTGDAVGSVQGGATKMANNPFTTSAAGAHSHTMTLIMGWGTGSNAQPKFDGEDGTLYGATVTTSTDGAHTHTILGGDTETRPINANVIWIIKY